MRWFIPTLLMLIMTSISSCRPAGRSVADDEPFGLTAPLRLASTTFWKDGGTVDFVVVDAAAETLAGYFDGRMRSEYREMRYDAPTRCYVGGKSPHGAGAKPLPLWGSEERGLVRLLAKVVSSTPVPPPLTLADCARGGVHPSDPRPLGRAVEARRESQDAIDQGLLLSPQWALRCFPATMPLRVDSVETESARSRFVFRVHDANGNSWRVSFPATADSALAYSSVWMPGETARMFQAGQGQDRALVTLVILALANDVDGTKRPTLALSLRRQSIVSLREILKIRVARIREIDAKSLRS